MSDIIKINAKDLSLVENNSLNAAQLQLLLKATPAQYVKSRPAKGGGQWNYVSGGYVRKVLNLMFGWDWDFEIMEQMIEHGEAIVKGRLTCRVGERQIVKMQFGNKEVMCRKKDGKPLSIGNDFKAAATDALKKCAAELGVAQDVYNRDEFRAVNVAEEITLGDLVNEYNHVSGNLTDQEDKNIKRIIADKDENSYEKAYKLLESKS